MFVPTPVEFKVEGVREQMLELHEWLARAGRTGTAAHEVERHLLRQMLALGRSA